jgi:hypothetical protein
VGRHSLHRPREDRADHGADDQWAGELAAMGDRCGMELCPNWSGDGNVCPCAVFGLRSTTFPTADEAAPCRCAHPAHPGTRCPRRACGCLYHRTTAQQHEHDRAADVLAERTADATDRGGNGHP